MRFTCSQIVPWSTLIRAQFPFTATAFLHFSYTPPHFYSLKHFRHMCSSDIMIIFIMEKSQSGLRLNTANWFSKSRKSRQNFPKLNELESELCRWQVVGLFVSLLGLSPTWWSPPPPSWKLDHPIDQRAEECATSVPHL